MIFSAAGVPKSSRMMPRLNSIAVPGPLEVMKGWETITASLCLGAFNVSRAPLYAVKRWFCKRLRSFRINGAAQIAATQRLALA